MTPDCTLLDREDLARGYARGSLDAATLETYETHLVGCAACQGDVRLAMTLREMLSGAPSASTARRFVWALPVGVAAAAAAIVFSATWRGGHSASALGAVTVAPAYLGVAVRGAPADSFEDGMRLYNAGTWSDAAKALSASASSSPDVADASWFFAGAASLMAGKDGDAVASFGRVIALGANPYVNEAHYYRAKAHLRTGRSADALTDLRQVDSSSAIGAQARSLADSVIALGVR